MDGLRLRRSYATKMSNALCKDLNVMGFVWDAHDNQDPFLMPRGHTWDLSPEHLLELLVCCIFEAQNPVNGLQHITGVSLPSEYSLRKCMSYDAIEYKGTFEQLTLSWEMQEEPPASVSDPGVAPQRAATENEVGPRRVRAQVRGEAER